VSIGDEFAIFDKDGTFKSLVNHECSDCESGSKLELITMSNNGEKFLFLNTKSNELEVYTLELRPQSSKEASDSE
jgi:hypothetical protein